MQLTAKGVTENDTYALLGYFDHLAKDKNGGYEICEGVFMHNLSFGTCEYTDEEGEVFGLEGDVNCLMQPADMTALMRKLLREECIDLKFLYMDLWDRDERIRCAYAYKRPRKGCTGKLRYAILPDEYWPTDEEMQANRHAISDAFSKHHLTARIPLDYGRCDNIDPLAYFPEIKFRGIGVDRKITTKFNKEFNE